jgi:mRNA interferase MazF
VERIILDAEAGQVSAELVRRGIAAFDWLADEPELYSDADLVERAG